MATAAPEGQQAAPADDSAGDADGDRAVAVLDLSRPVPVHPLTYLDEGDEVTVGRRETDSYVVLPADGAALLRRLEEGDTPAGAAAWYEETYGETVDMADFCETLDELGFLRDERDATPEPAGPAAPVRWQRLGAAIFSLPGAVVALALVALTVAEMIRVPGLAPRYTDVFFSRSMVLNGVVLAFGQIPLVLVHEAAHALAGRRLGLRSRLSIGRRLYYLVFLTELNGLVTVERRKRYLPMLAGMITDVLVTAAFVLAADATRSGGHLTVVGRMLLAIAYFTVIRILWQFLFYLETDLYYVAVTVLGCVDLQKTARRVAFNNLARLFGRREPKYDESVFHPRDREVARWYSWLIVVGYTLSLGLLLLTALPVLTMLRLVLGRFLHPAQATTGGLVDSAVFVLVVLAQFYLLLRPTLRARRAARAAAAGPGARRALPNGES